MINKELLKKYLEEKGISHAKFGEMIGCNQQFVSFMLMGKKQPSIALLASICEVTGYSADELLVRE